MSENIKNDDYTPDLINLTDEDGKEYNFEVLDRLDIDSGSYLALIPVYDDPKEMLDDEGDLVIAEVKVDENGDEYFSDIEDDDEYDTVADLFIERLSELYDVESK